MASQDDTPQAKPQSSAPTAASGVAPPTGEEPSTPENGGGDDVSLAKQDITGGSTTQGKAERFDGLNFQDLNAALAVIKARATSKK